MRRCLGVLVLAMGFLLSAHQTHAQSNWSTPQIVAHVADGSSLFPAIDADPFGNVHVVWPDSDEQGSAIFYSRRLGDGWTVPVDILTSPDGSSALNPHITHDLDGNLHVIWLGSGLYYSTAPVESADSPFGWSAAVALESSPVNWSDISVATDGSLDVVYSLRGADTYHRRSTDQGLTWSDPVSVSQIGAPGIASHWPTVAAGEDGTIHVAWTLVELPEGWPPTGIYYRRSEDGGRTWSEVVEIERGGYDQATVTALPEGKVLLVWNGMAGNEAMASVGGRHFRLSEDNGLTWESAARISGEGFTDGLPAVNVDSSGVVHLVTKLGDGVTYLSWAGSAWENHLSLSRLLARSSSESGLAVGNVENAVAALGGGNRLHVAIPDRNGRLWYLSHTTAAPAVEPLLAPTRQPAVVAIASSPSSQPEATATVPLLTEEQRQPGPVAAMVSPIPIAIGSAGAICLLLILWRAMRSRHA